MIRTFVVDNFDLMNLMLAASLSVNEAALGSPLEGTQALACRTAPARHQLLVQPKELAKENTPTRSHWAKGGEIRIVSLREGVG